MRPHQLPLVIIAAWLLAACRLGLPASAPGPTATGVSDPAASPVTPLVPSPSASVTATALESDVALPIQVAEFPGAESVSIAPRPGGGVYVVYGRDTNLFVARSEDGRTFSDAVPANAQVPVFVLPVERPALAAAAGHVGVAWLEHAHDSATPGTRVWYAHSTDGGLSFAAPQAVTLETHGETTMVRVALDAAGHPLLTWVRGTDLRFARSFDHGASFEIVASIGEGSCECCQPHPVVTGDEVLIAYRSLALDPDNGYIRDIAFLRSADGGRSFARPVPVSDQPWYLDACPISGPALAYHDAQIYVAWMDGRNEMPRHFSRGDVWFAASLDGGRSFSPNLRVSADERYHHTLPALAVTPDGRIHLAWQADNFATDYLYYTTSSDGGRTFAPPVDAAAVSDPARGAPTMAALAVDHHGQLYLAWLDRAGAVVAVGQ